MELYVKVYSLAAEDAVPVLTCKVEVPNSEQYNAFRVRLEEFGVDFWDAEARFRTKNKLEGMMTVDPSIYIIPSLPASNGSRKHCHLEVESISSDVVYCDVPEDVEHLAYELEGVETLPDLIVNDMQLVESPRFV
jgi:hypothetical protein